MVLGYPLGALLAPAATRSSGSRFARDASTQRWALLTRSLHPSPLPLDWHLADEAAVDPPLQLKMNGCSCPHLNRFRWYTGCWLDFDRELQGLHYWHRYQAAASSCVAFSLPALAATVCPGPWRTLSDLSRWRPWFYLLPAAWALKFPGQVGPGEFDGLRILGFEIGVLFSAQQSVQPLALLLSATSVVLNRCTGQL